MSDASTAVLHRRLSTPEAHVLITARLGRQLESLKLSQSSQALQLGKACSDHRISTGTLVMTLEYVLPVAVRPGAIRVIVTVARGRQWPQGHLGAKIK